MSVVEIYKRKTVQLPEDPYAVRVEEEQNYRGPIGLSVRWERAWAPYGAVFDALKEISGAPRTIIIALVEQAKRHLMKAMPNRDLAAAYAAQAVLICSNMPGMTRDSCLRIVSNAVGISQSLVQRYLGGGAPAAPAGGGGGGAV